jgi:hypothetical protein
VSYNYLKRTFTGLKYHYTNQLIATVFDILRRLKKMDVFVIGYTLVLAIVVVIIS